MLYLGPRCVFPFLSFLLAALLLASTHGVPTQQAVAGVDDPPQFLRGDVDGDGQVNAVLDVLYLLEFGLTDGDDPPCLDAADVNDDGRVHPLLDGIRLITWGWEDGPTPPSPGVLVCGDDPTADDVDCETVADACL